MSPGWGHGLGCHLADALRSAGSPVKAWVLAPKAHCAWYAKGAAWKDLAGSGAPTRGACDEEVRRDWYVRPCGRRSQRWRGLRERGWIVGHVADGIPAAARPGHLALAELHYGCGAVHGQRRRRPGQAG